MISAPSPLISTSAQELLHPNRVNLVPRPSSVCWGAIFAGMSAALALQVLFMMLGAGLGFAIYSPLTDTNPVLNLGAGALVIQGISCVFSLWFGGWVAGRLTPSDRRATGWLHGFSVWCAATVAGVLFVSAGAGWALGDLSKLVGGGLSLAGKPAAALVGSAADMARDSLKQSGDSLASFSEEALGNRPADSAKNTTLRAKREIGVALAHLFTPLQQGNTAANREALVKTLVDHAGMNEADANKTVTDWTTSYEQLKADLATARAEAELKAREAADKAAKALTIFSLCAFFAFALGALSAGLGGHQGARCAFKCDNLDRACD